MTDFGTWDYGLTGPWTTEDVYYDIAALTWDGDAAATVREIITILELHGYDSVDRELAFTMFAHRAEVPYDMFYNAWLNA